MRIGWSILTAAAATALPVLPHAASAQAPAALTGQVTSAKEGVGSVLELRMETTEPAKGNTAGDGVRHPSYGILGGRDGLPHRYRMVTRGSARELKTKEIGIPVLPGAVFLIDSAGGGGYGDPRRRDAEARAADARNGLVNGNGKNGRRSARTNGRKAR